MGRRHGCCECRTQARRVEESRVSAHAGEDAQRKMEVGKEKGRLPGMGQSCHARAHTCISISKPPMFLVPGGFNSDLHDVDVASVRLAAGRTVKLSEDD